MYFEHPTKIPVLPVQVLFYGERLRSVPAYMPRSD